MSVFTYLHRWQANLHVRCNHALKGNFLIAPYKYVTLFIYKRNYGNQIRMLPWIKCRHLSFTASVSSLRNTITFRLRLTLPTKHRTLSLSWEKEIIAKSEISSMLLVWKFTYNEFNMKELKMCHFFLPWKHQFWLQGSYDLKYYESTL